ncbi:MAG TPA: helix-turn-helix transcriptional regulator [Caulobacteraceae bacterium]|nr:helix-turn-helix transcriptional regulator [Caulobacteraceae bacterium]
MATSEDTLRKWENGRKPHVASYPAIIEFIGRRPWSEPRGLAHRLRCERMAKGLTIEDAAIQLGIDASTAWWWEAGRKPHRIEDRRKIEAFLGLPALAPEIASPVQSVESVAHLIRQRRTALGLSQTAAAQMIGANVWTLLSWEAEKRRPTDRFYPAIIRFLGREPWPEPRTLGERLRAERLRRGLSQEQVAAIIQVDAGSISAWEAGHGPHHQLAKAQVQAFISGAVRPRRQARKRTN